MAGGLCSCRNSSAFGELNKKKSGVAETTSADLGGADRLLGQGDRRTGLWGRTRIARSLQEGGNGFACRFRGERQGAVEAALRVRAKITWPFGGAGGGDGVIDGGTDGDVADRNGVPE